MEYDLSRIDYTLCGITLPETLKILQTLNEKVQQKVSAYILFIGIQNSYITYRNGDFIMYLR